MRRALWFLVLGILFPILLTADDSNYHLSKPRLLPDTLQLIQEDYVDPNRAKPLPLLKGAMDQIQKTVPEILTSCSDSECVITVGMASKHFPIGGMANFSDLQNAMAQIFAFIELHYHGKTKLNEIEYAAIDGILNYLDPHSNLLTPKIYNEFKIGTKGNFGGIGIVIGSREGELTVIAPLEGTPASRAGIKAKDHITQINDDSTINMTLTEAVEKLRGAVGTPVTLTVERPSRNISFTVTVKRAVIKIQSVQSQLVNLDNKSIGYVKIKSFQENTDRDMVHDLEAMQKKAGRPLDGLVLDLRNNPGGLLNQSISIADYFIKKGAIVSTVGVDNREMKRDMARDSGNEPNYPIVVLINEGSASASEIVAGALQANHRAEVIGSQSFGKGSVQQVFDLQDDSALKLTVAEYLTAAKYSIQSLGITPDITLIPMTPDKKSMDLLENEFSGEKDLEHHLDRPVPGHNRSTFKLFYFNPDSAENQDDDALSSKEYSNVLDLANDFPVSLASKLLLKMNAPIGDTTLSGLTPFLKKVEFEEMDKLSKDLEQQGIDWSTGPAGGKPQVQVSFELQHKGQTVSSIKAGEEGHVILKVRNAGSGPLYRLIAATKLDEPLFPNREFVIGKLVPGATRTWSTTIKMPKAAPSLVLPIKLYFSDANASGLAPAQILVPVAAQPHPQFAFRFTIDTSGGSKTANIEPLPRGKLIPLTVMVKNLGPGTSQDTVVNIKNTEAKGAFIQVGRVKLGKLASNQTATATLKFKIEPSFDASTLKLDLSITDTSVLETLVQPLVLTMGSGAISPQAGPWYQGPKIVLSSIKPPVVTTAASQTIQGDIIDDHSVKDYVIFVGDQKVAYQPNSSGGTTFPFKATLPLKAGTNFVTISARDDADLASRYTFTILRNVDKPKFWRAFME
jgi:carboxyl-terminal processing protease